MKLEVYVSRIDSCSFPTIIKLTKTNTETWRRFGWEYDGYWNLENNIYIRLLVVRHKKLTFTNLLKYLYLSVKSIPEGTLDTYILQYEYNS